MNGSPPARAAERRPTHLGTTPVPFETPRRGSPGRTARHHPRATEPPAPPPQGAAHTEPEASSGNQSHPRSRRLTANMGAAPLRGRHSLIRCAEGNSLTDHPCPSVPVLSPVEGLFRDHQFRNFSESKTSKLPNEFNLSTNPIPLILRYRRIRVHPCSSVAQLSLPEIHRHQRCICAICVPIFASRNQVTRVRELRSNMVEC